MADSTPERKRVYLYGMTLLSTLHRLVDGYPSEDTYGEIAETSVVPGGEAANAALILAEFGVHAQLDGTRLGSATHGPLRAFLETRGVDSSAMELDASFEGWRDIVLCAGKSRTVFGWFKALYGLEVSYINEPNRAAIEAADLVTIDPLTRELSQRAAELCVELGKDFVSIDCALDTVDAREAVAVVCSKEFLDRHYPGQEPEALLAAYCAACRGLVIFTFGARLIRFGKGEWKGSFEPYKVQVVDTLAAGDSFRAGVVYAVAMGKSAEEIVRYGAATAALVCQRFPSIHPVPTLREVEDLVFGRASS